MGEVLIETHDLVKEYANGSVIRALDDVSLAVRTGELVAIAGPSGSGKSTLLNVIGTLDRPTSGRIMVDGMDLSTLSGDNLAAFRREEIGFIFQLFNLFPALSALENVMLPLIPYRHSLPFDLDARAREILETVGLRDRLDNRPGELSGGEQQRVAIARALINQPKIVLADEPTGNLDSKSGANIVSLIRRLNLDLGVTILLVTHDAAIARLADRVLSLADGRLLDPVTM